MIIVDPLADATLLNRHDKATQQTPAVWTLLLRIINLVQSQIQME